MNILKEKAGSLLRTTKLRIEKIKCTLKAFHPVKVAWPFRRQSAAQSRYVNILKEKAGSLLRTTKLRIEKIKCTLKAVHPVKVAWPFR